MSTQPRRLNLSKTHYPGGAHSENNTTAEPHMLSPSSPTINKRKNTTASRKTMPFRATVQKQNFQSLGKSLVLFILLELAFAFIAVVFYDAHVRPAYEESFKWISEIPANAVGYEAALYNDDQLIENFSAKQSSVITTFRTAVSIDEDSIDEEIKAAAYISSAYFELKLWDADTGALLSESKQLFADFEPDSILQQFQVPTHCGATNGNYRLSISPKGFEEGQAIRFWYNENKLSNAADCTLNNSPLEHSILFNLGECYADLPELYKNFAAGISIAFLLCYLIYLFTAKHAVFRFVLAALVLGVLFHAILPPFLSPDEDQHFGTAYYHAAKLFTPDMSSDVGVYASPTETTTASNAFKSYELTLYQIPARSADNCLSDVTTAYYGLNDFYSYYETVELSFGVENDTEGTVLLPIFVDDPAWTYFPSILGIALGRLLGASPWLLLIFSRFGNYLVYIALCALGIYLAPRGRNLLTTCALLPSALSITVSSANDFLHCGAAILLMGLLLHLESMACKTFAYLVAFGGAAIYILLCGQHQLLPIALLFLLLPLEHYLSQHPLKRKTILFCLGSLVTVLLVWAAALQLGILHCAADSYPTVNYGLSFVLCHPLQAVFMISKTIVLQWDGIFEQLVGSRLGWNNISLGTFNTVILTSILLAASIKKIDTNTPRPRIRWLYALCGAGIVFLSFCVGFVWTNPLYYQTYHTLWGVQGRYFISALPFLLYALPPLRSTSKQLHLSGFLYWSTCIANSYVLLCALCGFLTSF